MYPTLITSAISNISPILGAALGGPFGAIAGRLISSALGGVDMQNSNDVLKMLKNDGAINNIKEVELQFTDLQNARIEAAKETGHLRYVRPFLAIVAHIALAVDIWAIEYVENPILENILIIFLVILVNDLRKIYSFYFGLSNENFPSLPFLDKKK